MPAMDSTEESGSNGPGDGSRDSGSRNGATSRKTAMTGTFIRNTEPHQNRSSRIPPTTGPRAAPPENAMAHTAMAVRRSARSGKIVRISPSVEGIRVAPPTPSSARAAMSISAEEAKAAARDAAPKSGAPISRIRRRPIRSPREPMKISRPASRNE